MLPLDWETALRSAQEELDHMRSLAYQAQSELVELRAGAAQSVDTSLMLMARVDRLLVRPGPTSA